eukprot:3675291-Lingulodinium_polyedra.AAC.1
MGTAGVAMEIAKALASNHTARAKVADYAGPVRSLLRGIGMGGPASTLLWSSGYDPVVDGV